MTFYQRIFGTGPRGLLISLILLIACIKYEHTIGLPQIHSSNTWGTILFGISIFLTLALVLWSVKSLSPQDRGRVLVTRGAFQYFRHPLYAAFLLFFNFGLAIYLNNYLYLLWAFLQHPVWHLNIMKEEKMVEKIFGENYTHYCHRTGRFIPKFWHKP